MAILQKILEIQKTIQVEKTGEHPKYGAFMRDEDVVNAVRAELNKHGIVVTSEVIEATHGASTDANGRYRPSLFARINFTFTDVEDGTSATQGVFGEGASIGDDVSSRKAFTQARKIAFLQLFQIGEVNDSYDSDSERSAVPGAEMASEEANQQQQTVAELSATVADMVNDPQMDHITGPVVTEVGNRVAIEILGQETKAAVWKKNKDVLLKLIAELENGALN